MTPDAGQSKVYGDADRPSPTPTAPSTTATPTRCSPGRSAAPPARTSATYPIHLGTLSAGPTTDQLHDRRDLRDHQGHLVGQRRPDVQDLRRRRPGVHLHLQRVPVLRQRRQLWDPGHRLVLADRWSVGRGLALHDHLHRRDLVVAQLQLPDRLDRELHDQPAGPVGQRRLQDQDLRGRRPDVHLRLQRVRLGRERRQRDDHRCRELLADLRGDGRSARPTRSPVPPGPCRLPTTASRRAPRAPSTITKATLSVNADPETKTYGDADPALTYTCQRVPVLRQRRQLFDHGHRLVLADPWPVGGGLALHDHLCPRDLDLAQLQLPDRLDRQLLDQPPGPVGQRRLQDQDLRGRRPDVHLRLQWVRLG